MPRESRPQPEPPQNDTKFCPVCHRRYADLAVYGAVCEGGEEARLAREETHVNECIERALQGSLSPPPATVPASIPTSEATPSPATFSIPYSFQSPSTAPPPLANTPEARMAAREQAHAAIVLSHSSSSSSPHRRTGVFPYRATEKDCIDDAECTICFEEFEVGVEMGRLECFCRFHLSCIRKWFETRPGQCPVHQHDGY